MKEYINYEGLLDMEVICEAKLGSTKLTINEILKLENGSIIDLNKPAGENIEFFINTRMLGKGEIMVYEKKLAFRVNEILDSDSIEYYLGREDGN